MKDNNLLNNVNEDRGMGHWKFYLYKPENIESLPVFKGSLDVNSSFHTVKVKLEDGNWKVIASIPSGNVSLVYDVNAVEKIEEKLASSTKGKTTSSSK
jgi:hypothetical protein